MSVNPATKPAAVVGWLTTHRRSIIAWAALYLGALAVLAPGVDHIQQYYSNDYSSVPTIGTLFFLNFVSAVIIAVGLIAPLRHIVRRYADAVRAILALGGIGLAALSLAGLFVSETSGLFGFVEHGYRTAIALAIVAEAAAIVFLVIFLAANGTRIRTIRERPMPTRT